MKNVINLLSNFSCSIMLPDGYIDFNAISESIPDFRHFQQKLFRAFREDNYDYYLLWEIWQEITNFSSSLLCQSSFPSSAIIPPRPHACLSQPQGKFVSINSGYTTSSPPWLLMTWRLSMRRTFRPTFHACAVGHFDGGYVNILFVNETRSGN